MTVPEGARFEAEPAGGVAIWDVSHLLPRVKDTYRDPSKIDTTFVHHSGALGRPGFAGLLASTKYVVGHRNFPGPAYTFWIPAETERDDEGRMVIYRANLDHVRSWHTGGRANGRGRAVALQGNTTRAPLTWSHEEGLEALLPWLGCEVSWHSIAAERGGRNKPACPGKHAEAWLRARY